MRAKEGRAMPVVHPICCGSDVHQAQLTACVRRIDADGQVTQEVRACTTTVDTVRGSTKTVMVLAGTIDLIG